MNTLSFFPTPLPGEDFRSVIYRYHKWSNNTELNETKNELFGLKSYKNGYLPRNILHLINKISSKSVLTIDYILNRHTLLPLFKPFLNKQRLNMIMNDVIEGKDSQSSYANRVTNVNTTRIYSEVPKYCPECMKMDEQEHGEAYLHLEHQLDFIHDCPKHEVKLISNCPTCNVPLSKLYAESITLYPICSNGHDLLAERSKFDLLETLSFKKKFLAELTEFMESCSELKQSELLKRYFSLLGNRGYINDISGDVRKNKLIQDVMSHFSKEKLNSVGIHDQYLTARQTMLTLFEEDRLHNHMFLHALIIWFLLGSLKNIAYYEEEYAIEIPFAKGPWRCYGPVCPAIDKKPIIKFERRVKSGFISGRFHCPLCGYTYVKRWHKVAKENYKKDRTVLFLGDLFVNKVLHLLSQDHSELEIARKLKVQKLIVRKYIKKIGNAVGTSEVAAGIEMDDIFHRETKIEQVQCINYETSVAIRKKEKIAVYRKVIKGLIVQGLGRTTIQRSNENAFAYLRSYDRKWLQENLPKHSNRIGNLKVDKQKLDNDLAGILKETSAYLFKLDSPNRIKRYSIINALPKKYRNLYTAHKEYLPLCDALLPTLEESVEHYQLRALPKRVEQLLSSGYRNVTLKSLGSSRKLYRNCTEEMKVKINEELMKMGMTI